MTMTDPAAASPSTTPLPAIPRTMQAAVARRYGGAEVIEHAEVPTPTIGDDEVLVAVEAAGLDRGVTHLLTGTPYLIRLMGFGFRAPKQPVLGADVAGRVVAVGAEVTRFSVGDRVFGIAKGSFAEYASAEETKLALVPENVDAVPAAVAAVSGITAYQAVVDQADVQPGQRVLVLGASGGVGTFTVQIAKALGAIVTGVGGKGTADRLHELGADHALDYTVDDFTDTQVRYDVIIDIAGRHPLRRLRSVLTDTGTLVIVGGEDGNRITGGIGRQLRASLMSPFLHQNLSFFVSKEHHEPMDRLADMMAAGTVRPAVGERFPLDRAADAVRHLDRKGTFGKTAIVPGDGRA